MYRGKYVAKVKIDFHIDPEKGFIGIDNMKKIFNSGIFDKGICDAIHDECISRNMATITLIREKAEIHEMET